MYYSSGNYEAFAHPVKPEGVEKKAAYIVGSGLSALATACYLIRDAQMKGERIHILEKNSAPGGAIDDLGYPKLGYTLGGMREMDRHFEVMWDLMRSIPSIETQGLSVLDDYYRLNKKSSNLSLRITHDCGEYEEFDGISDLSDSGVLELLQLFYTPEEELYHKRIDEVFSKEVLNSSFWLYWRTMFDFENWHSALEMKRYIRRFIHHLGGFFDFKSFSFTKYNVYESLIVPMVEYLEEEGVIIHYGTKVENVEFETTERGKLARCIHCLVDHEEQEIALTEDDLVFITNGSIMEDISFGDQDRPLEYHHEPEGNSWEMWKRIADQDADFGHPEVFSDHINQTRRISAIVTTLDHRIPQYVEAISGEDLFIDRGTMGSVVTVRDSSWKLRYVFGRQPQFRDQERGQQVGWIYSLYGDREGDYVKKTMEECTGREICMEWLYHIGVPEESIEELATNGARTVPSSMPYITAAFMPRGLDDRPKVVPVGSINFAFIGQFAETSGETAFTMEYSVRTAMEAVYELLGVDRGIPEVWGNPYDLGLVMEALAKLRNYRPVMDMDLAIKDKMAIKNFLKLTDNTDIEHFLREKHIL